MHMLPPSHKASKDTVGEMSEWLKEHDWKSCMFRKGHRGFESLSLHHTSPRLRMAGHIEDLRSMPFDTSPS